MGVEFVDPRRENVEDEEIEYLVIKNVDRPHYQMKDYFALTNEFIHSTDASVLVHWYGSSSALGLQFDH